MQSDRPTSIGLEPEKKAAAYAAARKTLPSADDFYMVRNL